MSSLDLVLWSKGTLLTPQHLQAQDRYLNELLRLQLGALTFCPGASRDSRSTARHSPAERSSFARSRDASPTDSSSTHQRPIRRRRREHSIPRGSRISVPSSSRSPSRVSPRRPQRRRSRRPRHRRSVDRAVARGGPARSRRDHRARRTPDPDRSSESAPAARRRLGRGVRDDATGPSAPNAGGRGVARRVVRAAAPRCIREPVHHGDRAPHPRARGGESVVAGWYAPPAQPGPRRFFGDGRRELLAPLHAQHTPPADRHLHDVRRGHPSDLWAALVALAGALTTFASSSRAFPEYDHSRLGECFSALEAQVLELLETAVPEVAVALPLRTVRPSVQAVAVEQERWLAAPAWYLAVSAPIRQAELVEGVERL